MKITNELGLPEALVKAVTTKQHNQPGSLSATTLHNGVKSILLTARHWEEITVDVKDRIWAVFGTAVHSLLESEGAAEFAEELMTLDVDGIQLTGRIDNYNMDTGVISDWKTASVWKIKFQDFKDWKRQGLTYAYLLKKNGFKVTKCRFIALLKDHSKTDAQRDPSYPQSPTVVYEFDVTEDLLKEIEEEIVSKIKEYNKCISLPDDDIPPCSPEERWESPTKYAVMKQGRKTAIRVMDRKEDAELLLSSLDDKHYLEVRPGECKKCKGYCDCKEFCNFYKNYVEVSK